jgi:hypothetical protein
MLFVQTFFQHTVKLCIVHTIMPPFCWIASFCG